MHVLCYYFSHIVAIKNKPYVITFIQPLAHLERRFFFRLLRVFNVNQLKHCDLSKSSVKGSKFSH